MLGATTELLPTALGWMGLFWTGEGLARLTFGHESELAARAAMAAWERVVDAERGALEVGRGAGTIAEVPSMVSARVRRGARETLVRYADGAGPLDDSVPLDLRGCTEFQRRVMQACRSIPYGATRGYRELAVLVGSPRAARAVGGVMARNPVPLFVPCHRVLAAGGLLGGFSAPQGLDMKRRLLELEK